MFKPVYLGIYGEVIDSYSQFAQMEYEEKNGGVAITINNDMALVDGLKSGNNTELFYKNEGDDTVAPTIQMLTYKDKNGNISRNFENKEGAHIQIVGGDYDLHVITDNEYWPGYYTCKEANLQVWVSKYNDNSWQELNTTMISEKYQWPGFGYFYDIDLSNTQIDGGWYDVKILISDNSGNYHEQTVKRAFYIGNGDLGINDIKTDNNKIIFVNNTVRAYNAQTISLFTISGTKIASINADKLTVNNIKEGVYMAVAKMANGSKVSEKIIIR